MTNFFDRGRAQAPGLFALLVIAACGGTETVGPTRHPILDRTGPEWLPSWASFWQDPPNTIPRFPNLPDVIEAFPVDLPSEPEPDDASLVTRVAATDSVVMIGLKPITSRPSRETGLVARITKSEILSLRESLETRGVRITRTFRNIPALVAVISPEDAPEIRRLPFVDYVAPSGASFTLTEVSGTTALRMLQETVDWGSRKWVPPRSGAKPKDSGRASR